MNKTKTFIENLNIYNGRITYNEFNIDESLPFADQDDSYNSDMLQIRFGPRYILDVGWVPALNPQGRFWVRGIKDYDWITPVAQQKCRSFAALKKAIEKIAKFLSHENNKMEINKRKTFIDDLNICYGYVIYNEFDIDESIPFDQQKKFQKKNLLLIEFGQNNILQVGWVREFGCKGYFLVRGIKDFQWDNSIFEKKCRSLTSLKKNIEKAAHFLAQEYEKEDEQR